MSNLSLDQVKELPDGTEVVIVWNGGNGPHRYVIEHFLGLTYTTTELLRGPWRQSLEDADVFIGGYPLTVVWLADDAPPEILACIEKGKFASQDSAAHGVLRATERQKQR